MTDEWYYKVNEQVSGPFARDRLEELGRSGAFGPGSWIRRGANGNWVRPGAFLFSENAIQAHTATLEAQHVPALTTTDEEIRALRREVEQIRQSPLISETKATLILTIVVSNFVTAAIWFLIWWMLVGPPKRG